MSERRLLVTGANGQVGRELLRRAAGHSIAATGLDRQQLDISDRAAVTAAVEGQGFAAVINAAAYTAVDKAESESERASAVNRDGPAHLAAVCAQEGVPLLHISTDYVFDGSKTGPYTEDDPVSPLGVYGASKEAGERAVRTTCPRHIILRTAWVYGAHGHNFVKTILRLAGERDELNVVADQHGCPTAAADIADALLDITRQVTGPVAQQPPWGTYHYSGTGATTWHGFAEAIIIEAARHGGRKIPVHPVTTADYPTPARRPVNSVLDCSRIQRVFGISPRPWREALREVIHELHNAGLSRTPSRCKDDNKG
ncbi:MAG TPA: dTDP-4-dehydrorhamnose reductase [Gammaproteobacteria bacterium]|nr:dTDP-4-dehydrorhamnose reductase [Gammaproteobacteria bacterium]